MESGSKTGESWWTWNAAGPSRDGDHVASAAVSVVADTPRLRLLDHLDPAASALQLVQAAFEGVSAAALAAVAAASVVIAEALEVIVVAMEEAEVGSAMAVTVAVEVSVAVGMVVALP
jgi:Zn-dependent membrane protease YugP